MTKRITIELTEDQALAIRDMVVDWRVALAVKALASDKPDRRTDEQAFVKRLETTLVKQLTKNS